MSREAPLLTLDEARRRIFEALPAPRAVQVPFTEAAGSVLAEEITAGVDLPPWDNSGMDGFAVRAADLAGAAEAGPIRLQVVGDLPAGRAPDRKVGPGEAVRIMTGAPIPPGADSVVMVEATRPDGDHVQVLAPVTPGTNIRRAGENVGRGQVVLSPGQPLRAPDIGLLASLGRLQVSVYRKPVTAVLSSGDELVPPDREPGPGQIRDSNRFTLAAHLRRLGFPAVDCGNAPDREEAIEALFRTAAAAGDVLVSSGGVSVGDYDLTKTVLARLGTMEFWRVAIRPGKPLAFGMVQGKPVFGLPGNPVSSLVVLDQLVRPALRRMAGYSRLDRDTYRAVLREPLKHAPGRTEFVRAIVEYESGRFMARTTGPQGSGILRSMSQANAFLIIPADAGPLPAGAEVDCQLFTEEL